MPVTLKLVTWNVENLFRPAPGAPQAEHAAYAAKLALLAQTLGAVNADVIALQEVGGDDALADLQARLGANIYDHRRYGVPDGRHIAVAFLSKLAFEQTEDIVNFPPEVLALKTAELDGQPMKRMGRGALRVRIKKSGFSTDLIALHLKSKLLTFPAPGGGSHFTTSDEGLRAKVAAHALSRRTAEAATVRLAANARIVGNDTRALAVLGDFNDVPSAATTQIFQGPTGSELDTAGFDQKDKGDGARLWNLAPLITTDRRYSRIHRGQGELLDQILVSEQFFPREANGDRRRPLVDSLIEGIGSIGDNPGARANEAQPDHAPVVATFALG